MRPLLIHASSEAASADSRRVLHMEYGRRSLGVGLAVA